jgi:tRNA-splicing ligase RtcB
VEPQVEVLPRGAVIPAAVGVDIGCGMSAVCTTLKATDLPTSLKGLRSAIEMRVPVGRNSFRKVPEAQEAAWARLRPRYQKLVDARPSIASKDPASQLGTLGTGNHFIEVCLDEAGAVWFMLHSGSRGVGNAIGTTFIELAKKDAERNNVHLPDQDLAYFEEGSQYFGDYVRGVGWAQKFARLNREVMMKNLIATVRQVIPKPFEAHLEAVNCHHNYVQKETHFGEEVFVTRKGAVSAKKGELGIIPGSMGARSYIVRGLGNPESFESCSHGAGRAFSRTAARAQFTVADHRAATEGVECRKDGGVLDETPAAYKPIEAVMEAQRDLVEVLHTLRQVVCVKG